MKKIPLFILFTLATAVLFATDTVKVKQTRIPILIDREDNVLFNLRIDAKESKSLNEVKLHFAEDVNINEIETLKLYYSGTEAVQNENQLRYAPVQYISSHSPGNTRKANPSYSIMVA
ncbi:MAG: sialidase, partial [Proteiniphilum sp.]|nr:sialidase [Proteiniphilum sp.]